MKIAYNSVYRYVQIETLNFTFAWQAIIVYFCVCQLPSKHCAKCRIL